MSSDICECEYHYREASMVYLKLETSNIHAQSEILQIAASCNNQLFISYAKPRCSVINERVTKVNGFEIIDGQLYQSGVLRSPKPKEVVLSNFLNYLETFKPVIIVCHNGFEIYAQMMINLAKEVGLYNNFKSVVLGFMDARLLLIDYKPRLVKYTFNALANQLLGIVNKGPKGAKFDVEILTRIVKETGLSDEELRTKTKYIKCLCQLESREPPSLMTGISSGVAGIFSSKPISTPDRPQNPFAALADLNKLLPSICSHRNNEASATIRGSSFLPSTNKPSGYTVGAFRAPGSINDAAFRAPNSFSLRPTSLMPPSQTRRTNDIDYNKLQSSIRTAINRPDRFANFQYNTLQNHILRPSSSAGSASGSATSSSAQNSFTTNVPNNFNFAQPNLPNIRATLVRQSVVTSNANENFDVESNDSTDFI